MKIFILLYLFSLSTWSADLNLFQEEGSFNDDFSRSILSGDLKAGERIHLKNKSFVYKDILGSGNTTIILRVLDEEVNKEFALRLPHGNEEKRYTISDGKRFINHTYNGYQELMDSKLPIPRIYDYYKDSYLLVDLVEHDFNLKTFLARNEFIDEIEKKRIVNSLLDFSRKTAIYESIGDFHLEQLVYSIEKNKWSLLDWSSGHQLARLPSSQIIFRSDLFMSNNVALDENGEEIFKIENGQRINTLREISEFERETFQLVKEEVEAQRLEQAAIDKVKLDDLKVKLSELSSHTEVLKVYNDLRTTHMASFFTMLQKDFIDNQLSKFPEGIIKLPELELLLERLGKFTPYYFSMFTEKILGSINNLDTFMYLYQRINTIGLDEELEDDVAGAIARNLERILSNTTNDSASLKITEDLKNDYGLINYRSREILSNAQDYLKPAKSCRHYISSFF